MKVLRNGGGMSLRFGVSCGMHEARFINEDHDWMSNRGWDYADEMSTLRKVALNDL